MHTVFAPERFDENRQLFGHCYEIDTLIARGGQGCVYAASNRITSERVALKLVGPCDGIDSTLHQSVLMEAKIAGRIPSEHIVRVFDVGWDASTDTAYLCMELLEGSDLQTMLERGGRLAPSRVVEYLRQVADGLALAHCWQDDEQRTVPIVHRDLKPANLFLARRDDGSEVIKILDFGTAKVLERFAHTSLAIRGTPLYMAPEQILGSPVSPATDVWAVGLIAFFLLTGHCYWRSGHKHPMTLKSLLGEVVQGATEPPSRRVHELGLDICLPRAFDEWFMCCVHRQARRRFATARLAIDGLAEALLESDSSRTSLVTAETACTRWANPVVPARLRWYSFGFAAGLASVMVLIYLANSWLSLP